MSVCAPDPRVCVYRRIPMCLCGQTGIRVSDRWENCPGWLAYSLPVMFSSFHAGLTCEPVCSNNCWRVVGPSCHLRFLCGGIFARTHPTRWRSGQWRRALGSCPPFSTLSQWGPLYTLSVGVCNGTVWPVQQGSVMGISATGPTGSSFSCRGVSCQRVMPCLQSRRQSDRDWPNSRRFLCPLPHWVAHHGHPVQRWDPNFFFFFFLFKEMVLQAMANVAMGLWPERRPPSRRSRIVISFVEELPNLWGKGRGRCVSSPVLLVVALGENLDRFTAPGHSDFWWI